MKARSRALSALTLAAVAVWCVLRYVDAVGVYFYLDDFWLLKQATRLQLDSPVDLLQLFEPSHMGFLLYRPLTHAVWFGLLTASLGPDPSAFHAASVLAFTGCALLAYALARRLTGSRRAALAAALLYAAAPGHAAAVYWSAAFTMLGTSLAVFSLVWCWLRIDSGWRGPACAVLQLVALLCSEHAVAGPLLLALVALFGPRREPLRRAAAALGPSLAVVVAYLALKLWLLPAEFAARPQTAYALGFDPLEWLVHLGRYVASCSDALALLDPRAGFAIALGVGWAALFGLAAVRSVRGGEAWRPLALASGWFGAALLPVLPLGQHFSPYYVGVAALGFALVAVAALQLATARWREACLVVAALSLALAAGSGHRAARTPTLETLEQGSRTSALWLLRIAREAQSHPGDVLIVPRIGATGYVLGIGRAHRSLIDPPPVVKLVPALPVPEPAPGRVIVGAPARARRPGERLPGWSPRWDWLRRIGGVSL